MKRLSLTLAALPLAAAMSVGMTAATANSPQADGYLLRGQLMYADRIYGGTIDQIMHMTRLSPDACQTEEGLYYTALASLYSGDDEALGLLEDFIRIYPQSARVAIARTAVGDYWFARGDYRTALKEYAAVDELSLASADAGDLTYRIAYSNLLCGDNTAAESGFRKLTGNRYYGNAALFYLAYIAYSRGDYPTAKSLLRQVDTSTAPGNAAPAYMAQMEFMDHDYDAALKSARKVIADSRLSGFATDARRIAGESLYNLGRRQEALPYLWEYAAQTQAPEPSALYILGQSEYEAARYSEAIGLLQKAISTPSPLAQSAYLYLGQAYSRTGNKNAALMAFENAYRMDFDPKVTETAFYNLVVAKMDGGKMPFAGSVDLLESFLQRFPKSEYAPSVGEYLVNAYLRENDFAAALNAVDRIANPSDALVRARQRALFMLGTREFANNSARSALERFNMAAGGPDATIASQSLIWKGDCLYALGQYEQAVKSYTRFINTSDSNEDNLPLAHYDLGYAYFALDRFGQAAREFREYLRIARNLSATALADTYNRLGDCNYYTNNFTEAQTDYTRAYEANRAAGDYPLFQSAIMMGLRRDHRGKIKTIDTLADTYPASGLIPEALLAKAESQSALGDNNDAIATLNTIVRRFGTTAQGRKATLQLAITYMSMGRRHDAIESYKKVITTYPTSEEARLAVDDLKRIYADDGCLDSFSSFMASVPNAPSVDPSEFDSLAFQSAEKDYITNDRTQRLEQYLAEYPSGVHSAQALLYLATAATDAGKPAEALTYATRVTAEHPDADVVEDALLLKAGAEADLGRTEPALNSYRLLEERSSGADMQREARLGIMRAALELQRHTEALQAADRLMATSAAGAADMAEIRYSRGMALEALGRHDEAQAEWEKVVAEYPADLSASQSAVALGQSLLDRRKLKKARGVMEEFINSNPPQPYWLARGFIVLSDILRAQGDKFEADEYLKSLRNNYPGSESDIFRMIDERLK